MESNKMKLKKIERTLFKKNWDYGFIKNLKNSFDCCRIFIFIKQSRDNNICINDSIIFHILFLLSVCADFCVNFIKSHLLKSVFLCFFSKLHKSFFSFFKRNFSFYSHAEWNTSFFNGFFKKNSERCRQIKSELLENACCLVLQIFVYSNLYQCACHNSPPKTIKNCTCNLNICECNVFVNKNKKGAVYA